MTKKYDTLYSALAHAREAVAAEIEALSTSEQMELANAANSEGLKSPQAALRAVDSAMVVLDKINEYGM